MHSPESSPQPRLRLAEARSSRGLSQQEVADHIGTTHVNVSRWERGITKPSPYFRRKLLTLFGKSEEELDLTLSVAIAEEAPVSATMPVAPAGNVPLYDPAIPLLPAIELVGREEDLANIKRKLVSGGNVALTALNGLPGVGKTALSITLAHDPDIRAHFHDGVLWAGLGPNPNMPGLLSRWGTLLGISANKMATLSSNEAWAKEIRTAIGPREMLLVIDDAWKLEEALTFRVGGPGCAHLVTTRFPNIASHMAVGGPTMLHELSEDESIELLSRLAPQVVTREVQKVHDLVHAVGGLPLALTLMGNYLRKQAYSGPARRITAALERLSDAGVRLQIEEPHVPVESHPSLPVEISLSLQSVIAVTDQLLQESARATLYALSVFPPKPNTFSEEAALAVAACTIDELDMLSDTGLLESTASDRYQLHQVIADYARLHLGEVQARSAHARLIAYITDYVETHKKDYELLELESSTILAALEIAHEQGWNAELVRAVCAFAPFLILRGFYAQAELHLKRAHEAAVGLKDDYGVTGTLLYLGEDTQKLGNYVEAYAYLQQGLDLARQVGDHERICDFLTELGEVMQKQGEFSQAETFYLEGLTLARDINERERICTLLNNLGWLTLKRGEFAQAEAHLQEGLTLARQIGDRERICGILRILGSVFGSRGDFAQSEKYLLEGLGVARQIGDREQICGLLINLGVTAGGQGDYTKSEIYLQEGLELARQIKHREWISLLLINLGDISSERENYLQAENYFREGLDLARQLGHREWISVLLINLGAISQKQGEYIQAEIYLQESLELAKLIGRLRITHNALYEYGNLYLAQNQIESAEINFREILQTVPAEDQEMFALAHYGLARSSAVQGNYHEAQRLSKISIAAFEAIGYSKAAEIKRWLDTIKIDSE